MTNACGEEKAGYGRPPKQHQFKKGQSGNPRGRPKGRKSMMAELHDALNERVWVQVAGRRRSMTKVAAGAKQFANKVASGDPQALKMLIGLKDSPELGTHEGWCEPFDPLAAMLERGDKIHERLKAEELMEYPQSNRNSLRPHDAACLLTGPAASIP
jgi:hypothetical protein